MHAPLGVSAPHISGTSVNRQFSFLQTDARSSLSFVRFLFIASGGGAGGRKQGRQSTEVQNKKREQNSEGNRLRDSRFYVGSASENSAGRKSEVGVCEARTDASFGPRFGLRGHELGRARAAWVRSLLFFLFHFG